jgi:adenylate kinase
VSAILVYAILPHVVEMMNPTVVILRNIASDVASILERRDRRRAAPFLRLGERTDEKLGKDLGAALTRVIGVMQNTDRAASEELEECLVRLRRALGLTT